MSVHIEPLISFFAAPRVLGSKEATSIVTRASANGSVVGVGGLAGVGIINPTASVGGTITTGFNGTVQNAGNVTVRADVIASSLADGSAVSAGLGGGGNNVTVTSNTAPVVTTTVGGNITASGDIVVESAVQTKVEGYASGTAVSGVVSIGSITVNAKADADIDTTLLGASKLTSTGGNIRIGSYHRT
jgi:hypothetical protein